MDQPYPAGTQLPEVQRPPKENKENNQ